MLTSRLRAPWLPVCLALIPLLLLYLGTLQTIPNGSSHYFMIDAGETQIVLNEWGSLHPTGYPLYTISGNALTAILRSVGISPIIAPALVSLLWGMLALLLLYVFCMPIWEHHPGWQPVLPCSTASREPSGFTMSSPKSTLSTCCSC